MKRLLFLAQVLPYPPNSGVAIRTFNVLRLLAGEFSVRALFFYRRQAHPQSIDVQEATQQLRTWADVHAFPIEQEWSRIRFASDHARSLWFRRSYTRFTYGSRPFGKALAAALQEGFDVIHVDSLDLVAHLPRLPLERTVLVHHNVESKLMERRSAASGNLMMRRYLAYQAGRLRKDEQIWMPRVALNIAVSAADREELERQAPCARMQVVPNGVDTEEYRPQDELRHSAHRRRLVFVGGADWLPNLDALEYFGQHILPLIRADPGAQDLEVDWVGRASQAQRTDFAERFGIHMTGYVKDVRPYLARAACMVVPLRVGGGTRLKITTAWAMGCPIVSTSLGCEGLAARDGANILIADDPGDFAARVVSVLTDPSIADPLRRAARRTAEDVYSWRVIGQAMLPSYIHIARHHQPGSSFQTLR